MLWRRRRRRAHGSLAIYLADRAQAALVLLAAAQELPDGGAQGGLFALGRAVLAVGRVARLLGIGAGGRVARGARVVVGAVRCLVVGGRTARSRDTRGAALGARAAARGGPARRRRLWRRGRVFQDRLWDVDARKRLLLLLLLGHGGRGKAGRHGRGGHGLVVLLQLALGSPLVFDGGGAGNAGAGVAHGEFVVVEGTGHGDGTRDAAADGLVAGSGPLRRGGGGRRGGGRAAKDLGLHVDVVDRGRVPGARQEELARRAMVGGGIGGGKRCWW